MVWKLASFNVNGIRARLPILAPWVELHLPDVLCLQEIKCQEGDFPVEPFLNAGYRVYVRGQKSFNGVAILSRKEPEAEHRTFDDGEPDEEARLIAVFVDGVWVVNTYVPQGREPGTPAFHHKLNFFRRLKRWMQTHFHPEQPIVWTGDLNVAPEEIDVFDPRRMDGMVGFHPDERLALKDVVSWGFVDLFRFHHPDRKQFTFWDYRLPKSFERNLGWRLDHIMVTRSMAASSMGCLVDTELRSREKPSDHTPIWAEFDLAKLGEP